MRPPRRIIVFSEDESQRSEWFFAVNHHSPTNHGVYYSAEPAGDIRTVAQLIAIDDLRCGPPRAMILCARNLKEAERLVAALPVPVPTVVVTPAKPEDWPARPSFVSCATHERWVVFAHLDLISSIKRGPRKGSHRRLATEPVPA